MGVEPRAEHCSAKGHHIPVHLDRPDERTGREGRAKNAEISTRDLISACSGVASPPPPFWSVCIGPGRARDGTGAVDHATPHRVVLLHPGLSRHHHLDHPTTPYHYCQAHQATTLGVMLIEAWSLERLLPTSWVRSMALKSI